MHTYKLCKPFPPSNEITMVKLIETNTFIPFVEENADYQAYLKWLEEGNTPLPTDE